MSAVRLPENARNASTRFLPLFLLALSLVLLGSVGAWWVQTAGGRVSVSGFRLPTENGQWLAADLFRPREATDKAPVPLVVICPGFERSKETMEAYSIELARRGIAVICIDPYAQGASSASLAKRSTTTEGNGLVPMLEYVFGAPNLNYIDKSRVGIVGYSAGGNAVLQTSARIGAGKLSPRVKLAGAFAGGYVLTLTEELTAALRGNVAIDYARHDEGAFRNKEGHARMDEATEARLFVNAVLGETEAVSRVELGKAYGDPIKGTLRQVYNTPNLHPLMTYDPRHIAHVLDFFHRVFHSEAAPPVASQVWPYKELFGLISLVGALLGLVPAAALLLRLPFFEGIVYPVPPAQPALAGRRMWVFWGLFGSSALLACFLFVPLARLSTVLFVESTNRVPTWFFPERINNAILLWAVANGFFGLLVYVVTRWIGARRGLAQPWLLGTDLRLRELVRTALLALLVWAGFYALLFAVYAVFHVDFRFTYIAAAADFPVKMVWVVLEYLPFFLVFYLANSLRVNVLGRFEGQRPWVNGLVNALGNSVGLALILVIQYSALVRTGTVYWREEWLYVNLLLGIIPMMFLLPYLNRWCFKLTGRIYLGPLLSALVFVSMMLTGNVCYLPF